MESQFPSSVPPSSLPHVSTSLPPHPSLQSLHRPLSFPAQPSTAILSQQMSPMTSRFPTPIQSSWANVMNPYIPSLSSSAMSPHQISPWGSVPSLPSSIPQSHPDSTNSPSIPRPKITTTLWEDENTMCYQVDARGICVARRQDNNMINGTKLLNVVGMSRGKRDGILKNEKGRVVVKVGAMHLKGVWITFNRAKTLANQFKIADLLFPLFVDDPSIFLYTPHPFIGASNGNIRLMNNNSFNSARQPLPPTTEVHQSLLPYRRPIRLFLQLQTPLLVNSRQPL